MKIQQENFRINLRDLQAKHLINTNATKWVIINEVKIGTIHRQDEDIHLTLNEKASAVTITSFPSQKGIIIHAENDVQIVISKNVILEKLEIHAKNIVFQQDADAKTHLNTIKTN